MKKAFVCGLTAILIIIFMVPLVGNAAIFTFKVDAAEIYINNKGVVMIKFDISTNSMPLFFPMPLANDVLIMDAGRLKISVDHALRGTELMVVSSLLRPREVIAANLVVSTSFAKKIWKEKLASAKARQASSDVLPNFVR